MRRIILLAVLIIGYYHSSFAQTGHQLKIDTTSKKFSFRYDKKALFRKDSLELDRKLYDSKKNKNQGISRDSGVAIINRKNKVDKFSVKPQGNFPMPVYKPDTVIKHKLLIKKE